MARSWFPTWPPLRAFAWCSMAAASCFALGFPDALHAAPAGAPQNSRIDIPAGPLSRALAAWSQATGLSVGLPGALPPVASRPVHGTMSPAEALRHLLRGTGFHAVEVNPRTFRLVKDAPPPRPLAVKPAPRPARPREPRPHRDIIVTATKQPERLGTVPIAIDVARPDRLATGIVSPDSETVASGIDGLAFTNLGPGRNRAFIRGIADSPFNGPSQSTVAVVLDDSRITYDAPDPDLLLVDVSRVEVLKGPQGPLYGSGALGGIYRIVGNAPDASALSVSGVASGEASAHGALGGGADVMVNAPIITDKVAVRAVGYYRHQPGWLDDAGGAADTNSTMILGMRAAARWTPDADWRIDVGGALQSLNAADSQYVTGTPDTLTRVHPIAEPADNDFAQAHADVHGRIGGLRLVAISSYVAQQVKYQLDASAAAPTFGVSAPARYTDDRHYSIVNGELRLSPAAPGRVTWLAGLSYLHASSSIDGTISAAAASLAVETIDQDVSEYAAFGELSLPLGPLRVTAGARVFDTDATDRRDETLSRRERSRQKLGFSPSLSLSWQPREGRYFFIRYARALRPGGLAAGSGLREGQFESDELESLEGGARLRLGEGTLLRAGVYYTNWKDVQSDYLLANGLISTRNAGRARIIGGDASVDTSLGRWTLSAGINAEQADLVSTPVAVHLSDTRLPVSPDLTVRGLVSYRLNAGDWVVRLIGQGNYVGSARLSFDPNLDRHMGRYAVFAAAATARRGPWSLTARLDNLFDVAGDSFAFGNPFTIRSGPQYTPLRPRTLTLSIGFDW
ncbi:MAG: TonB-dependent receptor domain-containing protein [Sphingomonas sp.]